MRVFNQRNLIPEAASASACCVHTKFCLDTGNDQLANRSCLKKFMQISFIERITEALLNNQLTRHRTNRRMYLPLRNAFLQRVPLATAVLHKHNREFPRAGTLYQTNNVG